MANNRNDKTNSSGKLKSSQLWSTQELKNYFPQDSKKINNVSALQSLDERYANLNHPIANAISTLLAATVDFLTCTDLNFSRADKPETIILEEINSMAMALKEMMQQKGSHANENKIISEAMEYCKESIQNRLDQLKKRNDQFYVFYEKNKNDLKNMLKPRASLDKNK